MRVLWFSHVDSVLPRTSESVYCGWIGSLLSAMRSRRDLELGIAAFSDLAPFEEIVGGVSFFAMRHDHSMAARVRRLLDVSIRDRTDLDECGRVLSAFKPDVVHVFGTEGIAGMLCERTDVPVVIHFQGLLNPCINSWLPPGWSVGDLYRRNGRGPLSIAREWHAWRFNRYAALREREILRSCRFFMGRTEWDKAYVSLYAPQARYFHCDEILRSEFLRPGDRTPPKSAVYISTLSGPLYKGHDVILKTAKVLAETGHDDFEWRVFGVDHMRFAERKVGVHAADVHVRPMGNVLADRLRGELLSCTAYVHPSHIDNSPNSVCEAQVLGVPVVATNVGGVSSIVEEGKTGFLVPANDPVALARRIIDLTTGALRLPVGWEAGPRARHDPSRVVGQILEIYRTIFRSGR